MSVRHASERVARRQMGWYAFPSAAGDPQNSRARRYRAMTPRRRRKADTAANNRLWKIMDLCAACP